MPPSRFPEYPSPPHLRFWPWRQDGRIPLLEAYLTFSCATQLFEVYLDYLQYRFDQAKEIPEEAKRELKLDEETFRKSQEYNADRRRLSIISKTFSLVTDTTLLVFRVNHYLFKVAGWALPLPWRGELPQSLMWMWMGSLISTALSLPFSLYSDFVVERKHGFNKKTAGLFVRDLLTKEALSVGIGGPLMWCMVRIIKWGCPDKIAAGSTPLREVIRNTSLFSPAVFSEIWKRYSFVISLWGFAAGVSLMMIWIYPVLIQPLFNKQVKLRDGKLLKDIEGLASRVQFPLTAVYEIDGSKRSAHSNAYMYGFWRNKRLVLFDTLMSSTNKWVKKNKGDSTAAQKLKADDGDGKESPEGGSSATQLDDDGQEEVLAIIGHELGHWKLCHTLRNMGIGMAHMFAMFLLYASVRGNNGMMEQFGFERGMDVSARERAAEAGGVYCYPVLIEMWVFGMLAAPLEQAFRFFITAFTRKCEFEADNFAAVDLAMPSQLKNGLKAVTESNLGSYNSHPWYARYHHTHPTLLERLRAIDDATKKQK